MNFTHEGIEITLSDNGGFVARVNGKHERKPSLDAMKKFITLANKTKFEPIAAMREKTYNDKSSKDGLVKINIIAVERAERGSKYTTAKYHFITDGTGYDRTVHRALVDTPENRAAFIAAAKYGEETDKIKDARDKEQERLDSLIKHHNPNDYANK